jgi:hypothetical protein
LNCCEGGSAVGLRDQDCVRRTTLKWVGSRSLASTVDGCVGTDAGEKCEEENGNECQASAILEEHRDYRYQWLCIYARRAIAALDRQ